MKIKKLPAEAISKLESGLIITDAIQCVLELVRNSLDAEATGVAVRIDLKTYQIRVIDNGKGIGAEDLEFVGEKFMTSKYSGMNSTFSTYGFKGQALSSLLDVCRTLTIETKSEDDGLTFIKVFENNKASTITAADTERSSRGTTVTVEDFMCTMPVRRKRISEVFDIEEIKSQLQYLAIMHYNVCFTLRNENKGVIVLQTPQASSMLESVSNIFGKTLAKSLKCLHHKEKKYEIKGFISLKPQIQSNLQLLYINKRIITKGVTHKFVNNVIKEYFRKYNLCADTPSAQIMKSLRNYCQNVFLLEICCPQSQYELFTNMRKTTVEFKNWKDVLRCLHRAVKRTFKEALNLDSSSNIQENDENIENELTKCKKIFGTSVLMNAVKGVPVKRGLNNKKDQRKRTKRLDELSDESCISQPDRKTEQPLLSVRKDKEISHDSLESPIPNRHLKSGKPNSELKTSSAFNQSFFEFYEWVKGKLETDKNAYNLYNDFLQFKSRGHLHSTPAQEVSQFSSPVVGGKPKKNKRKSPRKLNRRQERKQEMVDCVSALDEEMAIVTRHQLKIFPSSRLRMKKAVQFNAEMNDNFTRNFNFHHDGAGQTSIFKKPCTLESLNRPSQQFEFNRTLPSLASSEVQLTNIIQFRNWSEEFIQRPADVRNDVPQENALRPAFDSWTSHYQDFVLKAVEIHGQKSGVTLSPLPEEDVAQSDENLEEFDVESFPRGGNMGECLNKKSTNAIHDVEVQVNLSKITLEKANAVVQTSLLDSLIPESPYFKSSNVKRPKNLKERTEVNSEIRLSQEVPNPDFWNTSSQHCDEGNVEENCGSQGLNTKTPTPALINDKNSTSSEFLCGQKLNSVSKHQNEESISKETQTLAAFWADSLTEIMNKQTDSNTKSESTLPKTIPVEEIDCNILQPIQSNFYLTERHDFIPKGLSPTFSTIETNRTFTLTPREKSRLKVAVENAQSDLLATVKWQDESTGDCVKPMVPNDILDEMREKAEKNTICFENEVLSASLSYCAVKVHNLLHSFAFTKELLSDVEVLGQLDKKFIVTKMKVCTPKKMELISLFDQHAVDERIKLEELIKDYSESDGKFLAGSLNPPVECILNESVVRILSDLSEKLSNIGLNVKAVSENTVCVKEIPAFLLDKHEKDSKNKRGASLPDVLQVLITNVVDEMTETRGAVSKIPKVMHNAFCFEACHKAIKFNRELSIETMREMISKLKGCKLPFQCAHGRPSVIPIIDLEDFHSTANEGFKPRKLRKLLCSENLKTLNENPNAA